MKHFTWLVTAIWVKYTCLLLMTGSALAQPYLSRLSAKKNAPLYTTYAAALERSEFILDQGYQFVWYDSLRGINFETDRAGNLCLGFKLNDEFRFRLKQMQAEPVITASYSDQVQYWYEPFENIRVEVYFLVYSSRIAIQDVKIINTGDSVAAVGIYPFLEHTTDKLTQLSLNTETDGFTFHHREPPDGWTTGHGLPYQEDVLNAFIIDTPADAWGAYSGLQEKQQNQLSKTAGNYCVEWGRVYHADGSSCTHKPPEAQQIVLLNGSDAEILTEQAPKWGDPDPNIPGNGFQGCELGNFDNPAITPGDSFQVIFTCSATGEQGIGQGQVPQTLPAPGGVNVDIQLSAASVPPVPQNVSVSLAVGNTAKIRWEYVPGYFYSVYRRNISEETGEYNRIAKGVADSVWYDFTINPDGQYAYIVIARDSAGTYSGHSREADNVAREYFLSDVEKDALSNQIVAGEISLVALQKNLEINPGASVRLRIIRGVAGGDADKHDLLNEMRDLSTRDLTPHLKAAEQRYQRIPQLNFSNSDHEMIYWNAFSMIYQCMLPPEGDCSFNYYVFSREPTWGWGHGGQVFHESLTMLAYAYMDPVSAMNSQRVYLERQWDDGYINYRTGPYLDETIPYENQVTTSAPWFNWENWEIYQISRDTVFLREAYDSGVTFYNYWLQNRDEDQDGLCEWGAHAVLECVRDGRVAIWDQVGWPGHFESLDLNSMLVNEARSLAEMARELGRPDESQRWTEAADARSELINRTMWDPETGFYYHVDKTDHDFSFSSKDDLKRMEIIGFLPLWAGICSPAQAERLQQHLTDPSKFWRNFGIPTLAADDPYYNPMGYWNGPVWVEWQYLIFRGLLRYGFTSEARQLAEKVLENVSHQLQENHWFWELYSPDDYRAGHHKTYIWSGLVARMLIDLQNATGGIRVAQDNKLPRQIRLNQNYPNPFNPETQIIYYLPQSGDVRIEIFNNLGRKVRSLVHKSQNSGKHSVMWDGLNDQGIKVASGVYFCRLRFNGNLRTREMLLVR